MSDVGCSKIMEFYRGSTVLITGASGFVGQVLLEKILRSLEVDRVYVMIRPKWNWNVESRLQRILDGQLFDVLRKDSAKWQEMTRKVIPVEINLEEDEHLIVDQLRSKLLNEVNVVFNLLASVNFNEPLDCALRTNVEYTDRMLELVCKMKNIKTVVHVSTFYSNCDKRVIEERIYDNVGYGGVANMINIVSKLNEPEKQILTQHIIGNFPNTYTFSKKCAEVLIQDKYRSLPIGIFRPPIVSSTYREPVPGWIDNFNGPSGMVVPLSQGMYSAALLDTRARPFIVPVDYCVNALISCAVDVHLQRAHQSLAIPVYNYTDAKCNLSWGEIIAGFIQGLPPFKRFMATYFTATLTRNRMRYALCKKLMLMQAYLLDLGRRLRGEAPALGQIFEKMISLSEVLEFFCLNEWRMTNDNVMRVQAAATELERRTFPCDLTKVDWKGYYKGFVPGVIRYAIEPRKAKHRARKNAEEQNGGTAKVVQKRGICYAVWSFLFRYVTIVFNFLFIKH
uniref:Fatty acyl-CoA reductase n=1 Tax=Culex pipiens TaxID=7175 RepID=A0A8D8B1G9_CULPI